MNLRETIERLVIETSEDMKGDLEALADKFAKAAQEVYNEWEQDEEGYSEGYGSGGICDDIADKMCDVIYEWTNYGCFTRYDEYACNTSIYVYDTETKQLYNVDISPYNYETGGGYTWKKIPDVKFESSMVTVSDYMLDYDDYIDEDGEIIEH